MESVDGKEILQQCNFSLNFCFQILPSLLLLSVYYKVVIKI